MCNYVSLLSDELWEWGVEVMTFAHPSCPYQSGICVNKSAWLKKDIEVEVDWHDILPPPKVL